MAKDTANKLAAAVAAKAGDARPKMSGTVSTPIVPRKPNSAIWAEMEAASDLDALSAVESKARALGYSAEGRLMTRLAERAAELGEG